MVDYCSVEDVQGFLQLSSGFSTSSVPTKASVEARIEEAEDFIDNFTGNAWRSVSVVNEYHEFGVVGSVYDYSSGFPVFLNHRNVKALDSGEGDKVEVWDGGSWVDWLSSDSREEGRSKDFWLRYEDGVLYIRNYSKFPIMVRVSYRFGESVVPKDIRKACILLVCIDLVESDDRSVLLPDVGSSQVSYSNKLDRWQARVDSILSNRKEFVIGDR